MKRLFLVLLSLLCLAGCSRVSAPDPAPDESSSGIAPVCTEGCDTYVMTEPPALGIQHDYEQDGKPVAALDFAALGTYEWSYLNADGTSTGASADSAHPLEMADITVIPRSEIEGALSLIWNGAVLEFEISRWGEGDSVDNYTVVEAVSDSINVPDDGAVYIFEVRVIYEDGSASYAFMVK